MVKCKYVHGNVKELSQSFVALNKHSHTHITCFFFTANATTPLDYIHVYLVKTSLFIH